MTDTTVATSTDSRPEQEVRDRVMEMILEMAPNRDGARGPDTHLVKDLGYHSLALMEVAFAIEDEFDLDPIDEATARKITTVAAVQDLVIQRLAERDG
jgi:acyl carrier protein